MGSFLVNSLFHFAKSKKFDFCEMKAYNFIRGDTSENY